MDIKLIKVINEDYRGEYTGIVTTELSKSEVESQIVDALLTEHTDLLRNNINIDVDMFDVAGMSGKKIVRAEIRFNKYDEEESTKTITLREYA